MGGVQAEAEEEEAKVRRGQNGGGLVRREVRVQQQISAIRRRVGRRPGRLPRGLDDLSQEDVLHGRGDVHLIGKEEGALSSLHRKTREHNRERYYYSERG